MFDLLNSLGIDTSGFDRWGLHWAGAEQTWSWIFALLLLVAFFALSIPGTRAARINTRRYTLLALRLFSLLIILWCLFQPAIRLSQVAKIENSLAVMLDTSESMNIKDPDSGQSREEQALKMFKDHQKYFDRLERDYKVQYFAFDQGLQPLSSRPSDNSIAVSGKATEILESLGELIREVGSRPMAGVLMISDGGDNAKLKKITQAVEGKDPGELDKALNKVLGEFPVEINTMVCGEPKNFRDLAIIDVIHDEYGFVHNPFEVLVKLRADGGLAPSIPLTFKQGDEVIATRSVDASAGGILEVKLDFTPRQVGEFFFTVEVPIYAGESSDRNNQVRFPLKVLRDKVRVLYIVGNPSWDERFLRRTMKKNPSVDLVSFYILRERWDDTEASRTDVSLIPFPTENLFTRELENFDLIIFQNFYGNEYMPHEYMRLLRDYVKVRGGSYLVIGGVRALLGGNAFNLPLEEILPVRLSSSVPNWVEGEYSMQLTPEGKSHPIMNLVDDQVENERQWEGLPSLDGINKTLQAKPEAIVLGVHPFLKSIDSSMPVISVIESGAGRVMAVATDSTWRWNFLSVGQGKTARNYQRFWDNALRWLLKDPEMRQLSLTRDKSRVQPGEKLKLLLEVLDESYKPTSDAAINLEIFEQPEGSELVVPELKPAGKGKYTFDLRPSVPGAYLVRASASLHGRSLGLDEVIFDVMETNRELEDVAIREDILHAVSRVSGGKCVPVSEGPEDLRFQNPVFEKVTGVKDFPLWDNPILYALGLVSLGLLWFLRRRWGMS